MDNILHISGSASLAIHAMSYIAAKPDTLISAKDISSALRASEAHLHKVLQRLVKTKIVKSSRGPKGGFALRKPLEEIRLLDIIQAIEGPFNPDDCLFETPVCRGRRCIFRDVVRRVNDQVMDYLARTKLSELSDVF